MRATLFVPSTCYCGLISELLVCYYSCLLMDSEKTLILPPDFNISPLSFCILPFLQTFTGIGFSDCSSMSQNSLSFKSLNSCIILRCHLNLACSLRAPKSKVGGKFIAPSTIGSLTYWCYAGRGENCQTLILSSSKFRW